MTRTRQVEAEIIQNKEIWIRATKELHTPDKE
jgi:hypothetical protein